MISVNIPFDSNQVPGWPIDKAAILAGFVNANPIPFINMVRQFVSMAHLYPNLRAPNTEATKIQFLPCCCFKWSISIKSIGGGLILQPDSMSNRFSSEGTWKPAFVEHSSDFLQ
jgi:hypothetical protein